MTRSNDIDIAGLRAAEEQAQEILARAKEKADRLRREVVGRVAQVEAELEEALEFLRARVEEDVGRETAEISERSAAAIERVRGQIAARLSEEKREAVQRVIEELTRV